MYALSSMVKILCQKDFMSETVRVDTVLNCAQSLTILGFTSFPIFSPRTKKLLYIFLIGSELTDYIVSKESSKIYEICEIQNWKIQNEREDNNHIDYNLFL